MATNGDYIPASDGNFDNWQSNYYTYANDNSGALNLSIDQITALNSARGAWTAAYADQTAAQAAAKGATETKAEAKSAYIALIRSTTRQIQADPDVTNAQRDGLGITVPDSEVTPILPPKFAPTVKVDVSQRFKHIIKFFNQENGRAKPEGAVTAEVWFKEGSEPAGPDELTFVGLASSFTYERDFNSAEANQSMYYMARWMNAKGQPGPWSEPVRATVAA